MHRYILTLSAALSATPAVADTLIDNANGIQVGKNGDIQHFRALVVGDDGRVVNVLASSDNVRLANITRTIDAGGRTLLPGLIDAHGHVMGLGMAALQLDLVGTRSLAELQDRLKAYAAANPRGWIIGRGWNQELWPRKRFPTAKELDAVVAGRPVSLERVDGHALVVNSVALKAAGITAATKDPVGGRIERDSRGRPTGLLVDAATALIEKVVPPPSAEQRQRALEKAQHLLLGYGITAAADMGTSLDDWRLFESTAREGRLNVRIMAYSLGLDPVEQLPRMGPLAWRFGDRLVLGGVKFYADGALGSRGAWLKQPYADKPDTRGLRFMTDEELFDKVSRATDLGYQVAIHAIGDAANEQVIRTYEKVGMPMHAAPASHRWRIEHFQVVDPADIPRLAPAGIIASMQPTHQTSDRLMAEKRLGPNRLAGAYAWQTVLKSGARLAFGSDFPVESPNPFPGLSAAISRQDMEGAPPGGWIPSERLALGQALHAFTRGGAYAGFAEQKIGALEPGKWADFIVVDRDPTAVDAQSLARTEVLETWVAGKKVWERAPRAVQPERGR